MERNLPTKRHGALPPRARVVEPVFGQINDPGGIRRSSPRGLAVCQGERKRITATAVLPLALPLLASATPPAA